MLRITTSVDAGHLWFKLEGRLSEASAAEAALHWRACRQRAEIPSTVDLREVLGVDESGRRLISRMQRDGARLLVSGCAMRALVDELAGQPMDGDQSEGSEL